ncbi:MAG: hypothetical protein HC788_14910 [Sphingopyxis sp.]|nr:hypothetical protein [Sphingopyxis sp.]
MRSTSVWGLTFLVISGALTLLGAWNLSQSRHSILRNYPVIGHVRWLIEMIRPEIRQYLLEGENEQTPFSRAQRSLVYKRSKAISADQPFGTMFDVYADGYEFIQPFSSARRSG